MKTNNVTVSAMKKKARKCDRVLCDHDRPEKTAFKLRLKCQIIRRNRYRGKAFQAEY